MAILKRLLDHRPAAGFNDVDNSWSLVVDTAIPRIYITHEWRHLTNRGENSGENWLDLNHFLVGDASPTAKFNLIKRLELACAPNNAESGLY